MRFFSKALFVSTIGLFLGGMAHAEKPVHITTLTCTGGSYTDVKAALVYAYNFGTGTSNPRYFTAYLSSSMLTQLVFDEYIGGTFSNCVFANNTNVVPVSVTILDVSSVGVGVDVNAGSLSEDSIPQSFTEVDFSYSALSIGANSNVGTAPLGTPEEQAKAFAAFKARGLSLPR